MTLDHMVDSRRVPAVNFRAFGKHMSRERYQRGWLKKVGKTRKMWCGRWHVYVKQLDGELVPSDYELWMVLRKSRFFDGEGT